MREDARRLLAPAFAEILEKCGSPFLQPIHDVLSQPSCRAAWRWSATPPSSRGRTSAWASPRRCRTRWRWPMPSPRTAPRRRRWPRIRRRALQAGQELVQRGRRLGAYMQACGQQGGTAHARDATRVMAETAVDLEGAARRRHRFPQSTAGDRPATTRA
jgi:hypothetical protein